MSIALRRLSSVPTKVINRYVIRKINNDGNWDSKVKIATNGVRPQGLQEEDYIANQQNKLYKRLKGKGLNHIGFASIYFNDVLNSNKEPEINYTVREFTGPNNGVNCREEQYFYQQSLDAVQLYKSKNDGNVD